MTVQSQKVSHYIFTSFYYSIMLIRVFISLAGGPTRFLSGPWFLYNYLTRLSEMFFYMTL